MAEKVRLMRRGFIFTLDALLAVTLVTIVVVGIIGVTSNASGIYTTQIRGENKQVAENLLATFRTVPLSNLVPPTQIETWIHGTDPVLDPTYVSPQMPPLQIVATYWALNSTDYQQKAETIMKYLLDNLARGYKYQLIINNYTSPYLTFDNSYENASDVGSATVMVSGYVSNETPRGYVAKAYLTKLVTSQEKLVGIQRVLAGGYYCSEPDISSSYYNGYPLTVSFFCILYRTVPGDRNTVQSGGFQLSGSYSGGSVDVDEDLSGWSVYYNGYTGRITLTDGANTIKLYLDRVLFPFTTNYEVKKIVYEDASGNQAVVYLNSGVYVEVSWSWWYISSSRAYGDKNSLNVAFKFNLPLDASDKSGLLNYATRMGESVSFTLNGNTTSTDISSYLVGGDNVLEATFTNPQGSEIGFGSGSWISLKYKTSTPQVDDPGLVKLYNITSDGTGIYYLNSLFVPGNVTGISIKLTVEGVHEVRVYYSNGTALNLIYENTSVSPGLTTITIDNKTLMEGQSSSKGLLNYTTLEELSKRNFNLVIMLDAYYDANYSRPVRYAGQDYHYEWDNERVLYSYPDSYINITYVSRITRTRFMIPIEQTYSLNGENPVYWWGYFAGYRTMYFDYYLPDKAIPWYVDAWTAIHFTGYPAGITTLYEGPNANTKVFEFPLDYYLIRLAYTRLNANMMVPGGTNTFKLESDSNDYVFRVDDSRAIVHYFLNGYAGYGDIFTYYAQDNACGYNLTYWYDIGSGAQQGSVLIGNCRPSETPMQISTDQLQPWNYALDDAIYRLFLQLGAKEYSTDYLKAAPTYLPGAENNPVRVELKGLAGKAIGIKSVPATGGAITVTLRIWRCG
ncbi:hypothetical protein [Thermococcus aciditolerans]|uniref:Uncharacterized protein n=1 Tax=Thermococcus aciditolerans TaxID=2598455 RepID=A0A5C0SN82_9EURY|nr:hypothetical protein [Thermococcus aciditolerans]QEK14894.1 hypothetical protein FPV09_07080 [Thermococcus aciditolerans]